MDLIVIELEVSYNDIKRYLDTVLDEVKHNENIKGSAKNKEKITIGRTTLII